jgi:hypothetical protein
MRDAETLTQISSEISHLVDALEQFVTQTFTHRKKFQLAVSQFRAFSTHFSSIATDRPLTIDQLSVYAEIAGIGRQYQILMRQYQFATWAHAFLGNPSFAVPAEIRDLVVRLREITKVFDPEGSEAFNPDAPEWVQYHVLDLNAVAASLTQYMQSPKPDRTNGSRESVSVSFSYTLCSIVRMEVVRR